MPSSGTRLPWEDAARLTEIMRQPRFADAMRTSASGVFRTYAAHPVMGGAHHDMDRYIGGILALHLHATAGLTRGRFETIAVEYKLASRGRAAAILEELKRTAFIAPATANDRRSKRYVPTQRMVDAYRKGMGADLEAAAQIEPALSTFLTRFDKDDSVFYAYMAAMGDVLHRIAVPYESDEFGLNLFLRYTGGTMILCALLLAGDGSDAFPPRGPVPCSLSALSKRFAIGRAQVRQILAKAERAKFLSRDARANTVTLAPSFIDLLNYFFALLFAFIVETAQRAQQPAPRQTGPS